MRAALVAVACLFGLWQLFPDLRFAAARSPGDAGGIERPLDRAELAQGRWLRLGGPAEGVVGRAELAGDVRELVPLRDQPVVVLRVPRPAPALLADATGRLYRGDAARGWSAAADAVAVRRGVSPRELWLLVEGERPEVPWRSVGLAALLFAIFAVNLLAVLWTRRRRPPPAEPAPGP